MMRVLLAIVVMTAAAAGAQMPDPRQMSGVPLPVGDIPPGTVSVRVIRGSLDKPIAGQTVSLMSPESSTDAKTNDAGRAQFSDVAIGLRVKAVATVDGGKLESQEFAIPATGGIRLLLVASDPESGKRNEEERKLAEGPAEQGTVVLGDQTRFVFEVGQDGLTVFNILQILNTARTPVQPAQPVVFDVPAEGEGASLLEGSSPKAAIAGKRITIAGPFAPGATLVQFAYSLPFSSDRLTVRQTIPVPMTQLTVLAQKVGPLHVVSPQMPQHREMTFEGQTYIVGQGPPLRAGDTVTFEFTGLPHAATWPRNVALALVALILAGGVWGSTRTHRDRSDVERRRQELEARRDRLFSELVSLEENHRAGEVDRQRYSSRRRELIGALERLYAEMDQEAAA